MVIEAFAVANEEPREDDALSTFVLVLVTFVLTVESVEPRELDAPKTVPLTVVI